MKIKKIVKDYDEVVALGVPKHEKPKKTNIFWQTLTKVISQPHLLQTNFTHREVGMERLGKDEPALILMNHVGFIDFEIAYSILYPRKFNTVAAFETFMGLEWLMKQIGCFPTRKYIADLQLIRDIKHCINVNKSSVLMYPEAAYTYDGTKTTLPKSLAGFVKMLGVPLCVIQSYGAYLHQPIYNHVQKRKVPVSAELRYVLSPEEIKEMSVEEIAEVLDREFGYDDFRWQQENGIIINEPYRADGLEPLLYKCPHCMAEGKMEGKGIHLTCHACGKQWELTENGFMRATEGETEINHIPDWYKWERQELRREIDEGRYEGFDVPCDIMMIMDSKSVYCVGEGRISHNMDGFHLTGCDGRLDYHQSSKSLYTCESAFHWYELGDVISICNHEAIYVAMPKEDKHVVCKARLATEEIYKILEAEKEAKRAEREAARAAAKAEAEEKAEAAVATE